MKFQVKSLIKRIYEYLNYKIFGYSKEKLQNTVSDKLCLIAFDMQTTSGFPDELFFDYWDEKTILERISFINYYASKKPKIVSPIYYKDFSN